MILLPNAKQASRIWFVDCVLAEQTTNDPLVQKLMTLAGIGLITAVTLRAEIGRFDRFRTGKQLARFCGLTPRNASSGQKQADAGLIKAGNPQLRTVLVEAAHRLMRHDQRWTGSVILSQDGEPSRKPWKGRKETARETAARVVKASSKLFWASARR